MKKDRFKNFNDDERELVLDFENTVLQGRDQFFDVDEMEVIIDYYLEVNDLKPLEQAVLYAERLYPDSTEVRLRRAHFMVTQQQYDSALGIMKDLQHREPDNTDVAYSLGVVYGAMGESDNAIECFRHAAEDGWELGRIFSNMAEEYYNKQDFDEAIRYYQLSLDTDSYDQSTMYNYADTAIQAGRASDAAAYFRSFVGEHPYDAEGWHSLGIVLASMGALNEAEDAYEYALAADKTLTSVYYDLAMTQVSLGKLGEAVSSLLQKAALSESPVEAYLQIATLYLQNNNPAAAMPYLRKCEQKDPDNGDVFSALAMCHLASNDVTQAFAMSKKALRLKPDSATTLFAAAQVHDALGHTDAAAEYYERLAERDDTTEGMFQYYISFLFRNRHYQEVTELAKESLDLYPGDSFYYTYLAASYFMTNRYKRLSGVIEFVDPNLIRHLCPTIERNPLLSYLIPPQIDSK